MELPDKSLIYSYIGNWGFYPGLDNGRRMSREVQVRFGEDLGVKFPRATYLTASKEVLGKLREFLNLVDMPLT